MFRLGEGGLQFAEAFLQLELDDPCTDPVRRAEIPFLVDPDTGEWLVRDTLVALLRVQTQRSYRELHGQEMSMEKIIQTWSGKSFRIGGVVAYETMGATDAETAQDGAWSEKAKGHRAYSRVELQKTAARTGAAGRVQTQMLHSGPITCYPGDRPAAESADDGEAQEGAAPGDWVKEAVGELVWKVFPAQQPGSKYSGGGGACRGRVQSVRGQGDATLWRVAYEDGDTEDWDKADMAKLAPYLLPYGGEEDTVE